MLALGKRVGTRFPRNLFLQTELLDECRVATLIILLKVAKVRTTVCDHLQKPTTRVEVLLVLLEVLCKLLNSLGQNTDLHAGRAVIGFMVGHLLNDCGLFLRGKHDKKTIPYLD